MVALPTLCQPVGQQHVCAGMLLAPLLHCSKAHQPCCRVVGRAAGLVLLNDLRLATL